MALLLVLMGSFNLAHPVDFGDHLEQRPSSYFSTEEEVDGPPPLVAFENEGHSVDESLLWESPLDYYADGGDVSHFEEGANGQSEPSKAAAEGGDEGHNAPPLADA